MKTRLLFFVLITAFFVPRLCFAQLFGKNSVQYTNFDWHYIQSKHFDVYFYPGSDRVAEFVADIAESSYVSISNSWDYKLKARIVIVVYKSHNDFGQTNLNLGPPEESVGGFTEFFKNRVVIPYEGSYEQLRHVTHHELTHAMMLQMLFGPDARSILPGISGSNIPFWFIEGLAEYESRGWDPESDMFMRDAVVSNYAPSINNLNAFLAYKGGQSVLNYIADKYGKPKIAELMQKVKYSKSVSSGLQHSIGMGIEELNEKWQKHIKKTYWPDFAKRQEPTDFAKQITFHDQDQNFINNSGELSPKGDKIAYLSDKSGFFDLYLVSAIDGKQIVKLVSGQRSGKLEELHWLRPGITWHPDGNLIAFAAKSREQDALHIVDVEETKIVKSLKFDLDAEYSPDWSPDGTKIAFMGTRNGFSDIYVYDLRTEELTKLTHDVFSDLEPRWSPSGEQIVFISDRNDYVVPTKIPDDFKIQQTNYHQYDVYLVDTQSTKITRITKTEANEKSPVWSPDGSQIAFVSDRSGIQNIYVQDISEPEQDSQLVSVSNGNGMNSERSNGHSNEFDHEGHAITDVLTGVDHLSWEGERLAFTCFYKGGFDIYLMKNPLRVKPGEIRPAYTHFMQEKLKEEPEPVQETSLLADGDLSQKENGKVAPYRNFVFGDEFKKGQPVSAYAPKSDLFLSPGAYKSSNGEYKVNEYKTKFSLDLVNGGAGYDPFFGFQGASVISFSDLMGNHRVNVLTNLFIDFKNSDFAASYFYLPGQTDLGVGLFHFNYLFLSRGRFLIRDRNLGINLWASRPFDRYRRIEFGLNFRNISRLNYDDFEDETVRFESMSTRVLLANLAYVKDNVIWGHTGPKAGTRYNISIQASPDLGAHGLDFRSYQFDYRTYVNFLKDYTFAFRLSAGISEGEHKQKFFLGGLNNWINLDFRDDITLDLEDIYFSNFVTPARGFDFYQQVGSKFFLTNLELRIPLVNYVDMAWPLPLRLSNVRGSLFMDMGSAWDGDFNFFTKTEGGGPKLDDVLMSFGWGVRINLGILLLKYDIAWRTDLADTSGPQNLFSIGADF